MEQAQNPTDFKRLSRGWSNEMTPAAIAARLRKVSQLYRAWKLLSGERKPPRQPG